jgi:hypothetical protein
VRFVDFLKTTVLACAAAGTALGVLAVLRGAAAGDTGLLAFALGWWLVAVAVGGWLGRRRGPLPAMERLLAAARATTTLPEQEKPARVLLNRLWPLLVLIVASGALAWRFPQIPAIAERDGVAFYVERTSPLRPIQLVRTPGYRRIAPPSPDGLR